MDQNRNAPVPAPTPNSPMAIPAEPATDAKFRERQLALFRSSVLKQAKWRELSAAAGSAVGRDALDLGSDNGVISWLFREGGGRWQSADLTEETVDAIRRMVGSGVQRLHGPSLPFPDAAFDLVVVVDLLEHLDDDGRLLSELARCTRPGGRLILNVPHAKRFAVLPPLRHAIGLTDAWHGHRRAGYTRERLAAMLPPSLRLMEVRSYSRFFSHLLDTALNWTYLRSAHGRTTSSAKGMVVTGTSAGMAGGAGGGAGRMLRVAYPVLRVWASLDALLPWTQGYMLLATLERGPASTEA